jgi:hypothetical protein
MLKPGVSVLKVCLDHVGDTHFPRKFGTPHQEVVHNAADYLRAIRLNNGINHCHVSVYWFKDASHLLGDNRDYSSVVIDTIFIDIDDENKTNPAIWRAYRETSKLVRYLLDNKVTPRVYFSGNKGFHVYIDFPVVSLVYPGDAIKRFVDNLETQLKLRLVDPGPIGDIARVARIPNTKHMKSGLYCVPFTVDEFLSVLNEGEILDLAQCPRLDFEVKKKPSEIVADVLTRIDKDIELGKIKELHRQYSKTKKKRFKQKKKSIRPCIQKLIDRAKSTHCKVEHQERLAICCELFNNGFSEDAIVSIFEEMVKKDDFVEDKTRYFVKHAIESGYKPFKCKTLEKDLKICFEECPIRKRKTKEEVTKRWE